MAKLRVDKIAAPIVKDEFTGSVHFDGTDWLIISSSSDFAFGTGDFTIELWAYHTDLTGQQTYFGDTSGATAGIYTYKTTNNAISLYDTAQRSVSSNNVIKLNTWHHIAWTRESGVLRAFLDGVKVDEDTYTGDFTITQYYIGSAGVASEQMLGYISNLRVCKGHAVYTGNFTVPTRELPVHKAPPKGVVFPAADNVTVLLACQSSTDATADSSERHTITVNGDPTAADANPGLFRKTNITSTITENTGSVFFDGTGDYLKIGGSGVDFSYGTDDFTVETWIYPTSLNAVNAIVGNAQVSYTNNEWLLYLNNSNKIKLDTGLSSVLTSSTSVTVNVWTHIVYTRQSGTHKLYINGTLDVSSSTAYDYSEDNGLGIGGYVNAGENPFTGYISNLRICKGHAVYKSNFAPPTRELEVHPETVLLCCHDGENIFADKSGRHIIAAYGDRLSSPTPTATDSPIGITTFQPGLTRSVDATAGPTFQGGAGFVSQNWLTLPKGTTTQRSRGRGVFGGGNPGSANGTMQYVQIQSQGNALDFGDLTVARQSTGLGNATRGVFGGNAHPTGDTIDYIHIATTGNAVDFGNLQSSLNGRAAASNSTRGIFAGGGTPTPSNEIDFITIATLGNSTDFGNLTVARRNHAGVASPTRAVFAGGDAAPASDVIDYITISSTGNAVDFGNLSAARETAGGASSTTRGVFMGGYTSGDVNIIEYITIATLGDAIDFGDLSAARRNGGSVSNNIRGLYAGGHPAVNTIEFVIIASTSNATDFGDLVVGQRINPNHVSDSHGGLS